MIAISLRKSTLLLLVLASLLGVEVFAGVLRYVLDQYGLSSLVYVPKVAAIVATLVIAVTSKHRVKILAVALFLLCYSLLAVHNGFSWKNAAFAFFVFSPFFFGVASARWLFARYRPLLVIVMAFLSACVAGAILDTQIDVPWKGYSYMVGDTELVANRQWWSMGVDRVAGFSRHSAALAIMLGVFSLFVMGGLRSRGLKVLVFIATAICIAVTTNKSALVAYAIAPLASVGLSGRRAIHFASVSIGLVLPWYSILIGKKDQVGAFDLFLSSFLDRMVNTWPGFYSLVDRFGNTLAGVGFGAVGSSAKLFPHPHPHLNPQQWPTLGVADSGALYLWGAFGVLGIALYAGHYLVMHQLNSQKGLGSRATLSIFLFIVVVSWTTDVMESSIASLFLGLGVGVALMGRRATNERVAVNEVQ